MICASEFNFHTLMVSQVFSVNSSCKWIQPPHIDSVTSVQYKQFLQVNSTSTYWSVSQVFSVNSSCKWIQPLHIDGDHKCLV